MIKSKCLAQQQTLGFPEMNHHPFPGNNSNLRQVLTKKEILVKECCGVVSAQHNLNYSAIWKHNHKLQFVCLFLFFHIHPSIYPSFSTYPGPGRGCSILSKDAQTSISPASFSSLSIQLIKTQWNHQRSSILFNQRCTFFAKELLSALIHRFIHTSITQVLWAVKYFIFVFWEMHLGKLNKHLIVLIRAK